MPRNDNERDRDDIVQLHKIKSVLEEGIYGPVLCGIEYHIYKCHRLNGMQRGQSK